MAYKPITKYTFKPKPINLVLIKDVEMVEKLSAAIEHINNDRDSSHEGVKIDDYFIEGSFTFDGFTIYISVNDTVWTTKEDLKKIKEAIG